ncbi:FAD-dependent monooxygenase [Terrarubrum flagellatum]|uniref:FAD-dependent monooxygenase n=1 Tax=Terrirubrum flagellatum TaxID=2895980 RepID=UPI0031454103
MNGTEQRELAVVGGGAAGLACALSLSRAGFALTLVAPPAPPSRGRTVALFDGSMRLLRALGLWDALEPRAAPLERLCLIDDTGSLFRPPPATFLAQEIGLDAFGWNIDLGDLQNALNDALAREAHVARRDVAATGFHAVGGRGRVLLADGSSIDAALTIAADGGRSTIRAAADIGTREWAYPQSALTTTVAHDRAHRFISTEFHTRQGPFTFVPLPGRRSSIVWVAAPEEAERLHALSDEDLSLEIERRSHSYLGKTQVDGPRGLVPLRGLSAKSLTAPNLMLAGEAAHVFPPIGAQGLNLGLRDAATIIDILSDARDAGTPLGDTDILSRYEHARRLDVGMRSFSVDLLNRTLLSPFLPADALRGAGLLALSQIAPLRRFVMKMGIGAPGETPKLMRDSA